MVRSRGSQGRQKKSLRRTSQKRKTAPAIVTRTSQKRKTAPAIVTRTLNKEQIINSVFETYLPSHVKANKSLEINYLKRFVDRKLYSLNKSITIKQTLDLVLMMCIDKRHDFSSISSTSFKYYLDEFIEADVVKSLKFNDYITAPTKLVEILVKAKCIKIENKDIVLQSGIEKKVKYKIFNLNGGEKNLILDLLPQNPKNKIGVLRWDTPNKGPKQSVCSLASEKKVNQVRFSVDTEFTASGSQVSHTKSTLSYLNVPLYGTLANLADPGKGIGSANTPYNWLFNYIKGKSCKQGALLNFGNFEFTIGINGITNKNLLSGKYFIQSTEANKSGLVKFNFTKTDKNIFKFLPSQSNVNQKILSKPDVLKQLIKNNTNATRIKVTLAKLMGDLGQSLSVIALNDPNIVFASMDSIACLMHVVFGIHLNNNFPPVLCGGASQILYYLKNDTTFKTFINNELKHVKKLSNIRKTLKPKAAARLKPITAIQITNINKKLKPANTKTKYKELWSQLHNKYTKQPTKTPGRLQSLAYLNHINRKIEASGLSTLENALNRSKKEMKNNVSTKKQKSVTFKQPKRQRSITSQPSGKRRKTSATVRPSTVKTDTFFNAINIPFNQRLIKRRRLNPVIKENNNDIV